MTLHQLHDKFEQEFIETIKRLGFINSNLVYHSHSSKEFCDLIRGRYSPTALYVRTRADRVAIHKDYPIEFEFEAKTHNNSQFYNWAIEALPLVIHYQLAKSFDVKCLYAHYNPYTKKEVGFWVDQLPPIMEILIPERWYKDNKHIWFQKVFSTYFPNHEIKMRKNTNGSNDPYLLIDQKIVETLPHWICLILELTAPHFSFSTK